MAEYKRARNRQAFVSIMGGPHPTFSPKTFEYAGVDAYCVGEGEEAFKDFLVCKEKNVRYNIYLLGALIAKLPQWLAEPVVYSGQKLVLPLQYRK